ncbi:MAG: GNAT family N-acetyltransferase [Chloroflexota bacterium]
MSLAAFCSPRVVCRPALPCDTADVKEFCKFIWDGHDYVPYVWDDWLADPRGVLAVAEYGGRAVGCAKVSLSAPGQWWLHGFRVDPRYQGLKIGSRIHEYIDAWWLAHGDGVARLMTSSQRLKVHHLCGKLGYAKVLEVRGLTASPLEEATDAFHPLAEADLHAALEFTLASPLLAAANGLIDLGWEVIQPTPDILADIIRAGLAFWWRKREGLLLAWDHDEAAGKALGVALPACSLASLPDLLRDARRLGVRLGRSRLFWIAPVQDEVLSAAETAGFTKDWEHAGFVYEKRHPIDEECYRVIHG